MKKLISITTLFLSTLVQVNAQYYTNANKKWVFGNSTGLDFMSGTPVYFSAAGTFYPDEGTASVSDNSGALLFYTDGKSVWNKSDSIMPSGKDIVSYYTISTSQAAQIVQNVGNLNQYYLFSLENLVYSGSDTAFCRLSYSLVDMTLDGGKGDVVLSARGIRLDSALSEKMIAIPGNNCNIWLITHRKDSAIFYSYEITATGISNRIVSRTGNFSGNGAYHAGVMGYSPNGNRIVTQTTNILAGTELFDFDRNTGIISNAMVLSNEDGYGAEFSPDNTKLYASEAGIYGSRIIQYDITLPDTATIIASRAVVFLSTSSTSERYHCMRLAPNGKIYFPASSQKLACISSPNLSGAACGYVPDAVTLTHGSMGIGFPNVYTTADTNCAIIKFLSSPNIAGLTEFSVYPNPATNSVQIVLPEADGKLDLIDVAGRQIATKEILEKSMTFDVSYLTKGIYLLVWQDRNGSKMVQKLIIN